MVDSMQTVSELENSISPRPRILVRRFNVRRKRSLSKRLIIWLADNITVPLGDLSALAKVGIESNWTYCKLKKEERPFTVSSEK